MVMTFLIIIYRVGFSEIMWTLEVLSQAQANVERKSQVGIRGRRKENDRPTPIDTVKFKRNIINSILHNFRNIIKSLSKKGSDLMNVAEVIPYENYKEKFKIVF